MDQRPTKKELKELRKFDRLEKEQREQKSVRNSQIWTWGFIIGVLLLSVFGVWKLTEKKDAKLQELIAVNVPKVTSSDFQTGSESAKVTLIEYADFQCPACKTVFPVIKQLQKEYGEKLRYVYRFFPLTQIHKNAEAGAFAAVAAGRQNKFFEMHDMLYGNQTDWEEKNNVDDIFLGYAKKIGLDIDKYLSDRDSKETSDLVASQSDAGIKIGVDSTPTFYLNSKRVPSGADLVTLKKYIDIELKSK